MFWFLLNSPVISLPKKVPILETAAIHPQGCGKCCLALTDLVVITAKDTEVVIVLCGVRQKQMKSITRK